jgi:hypothetical protein
MSTFFKPAPPPSGANAAAVEAGRAHDEAKKLKARKRFLWTQAHIVVVVNLARELGGIPSAIRQLRTWSKMEARFRPDVPIALLSIPIKTAQRW